MFFQGDRISALEQIASDLWGTMFFAEKGQSYRIRVSNFARGAVLNLRWSQGSRPANDDFAQATVLEGAGGVVEGSSQGRHFGTRRVVRVRGGYHLVPVDGTERRPVDVLQRGTRGESLSSRATAFPHSGWFRASLVQAGPSPLAAGKEYRIVVAEPSAYASSGPYELSWNPLETALDPSNDHIVDAEPIENDQRQIEFPQRRLEIPTQGLKKRAVAVL